MRRRDFITVIGGGAVAWSHIAHGQTLARRSPRVGVLVSASPPHPLPERLRQGLRNLGYVEHRNIELDVRFTDGQPERAARLAAELEQNPT